MDLTPSLPAPSAPRLPAQVERLADRPLTGGGTARILPRADVLESRVDPAKRAQLHKAADDFENVFMTQMLGHMFDGIGVDETFGGGKGEEMFRPMLNEQFARQVGRRGGLGIASQVYNELLRAQEASHG